MKVIHDLHAIYAQIDFERRAGRRIGLVPTMGALHEGHLSLVRRSIEACDLTVATIFVNPTQFGPNEDLAKYPRTLESDLELLASHRCDLVFVPASDQIYRPEHSTYVEPPQVAKQWEGAIRPGHFRGVATIVLKLFQLIPAHIAFFGMKDYQQVAVIRAMVDDFNLAVRIECCPTVREPDGLAMSSRNRYLQTQDRVRALGLWHALQTAKDVLEQGCRSGQKIESAMKQALRATPVDAIDYAAIVHPDSMDRIETIDQDVVAIVAARIGTTRLIDNTILCLS